MRESDTVARLGGDEFAVLAHDLDGPEDALAVAERVRSALADPVTVADILLDVDASIGVALAPEHGTDVRLLHQPQAGTASGELRGVEALVRWPHPTRGLLGPEQFIPLAERTGLIRSLTRLVLEHAIRQCRAWHDQGFKLAVSVNITGRDLLDMKLPDEVAGLLTEARLDPRFLELEITENTILADPIRARAILTRLSELGVRLAIDDFGRGNSSLGYLKRLPVDVLKIDKSFVLNMESDEDDDRPFDDRSQSQLGPRGRGRRRRDEGGVEQARAPRLRHRPGLRPQPPGPRRGTPARLARAGAARRRPMTARRVASVRVA